MNSVTFEISAFVRLKGDNLLMKMPGGQVAWIPLRELTVAERALARRCHERSREYRREQASNLRKTKGYAGYRPFKTRRIPR